MIHFVDTDNIGCSVKLSKSFFSVFTKMNLCTYGYQATIYFMIIIYKHFNFCRFRASAYTTLQM